MNEPQHVESLIRVRATVLVPGDKSTSHRALMVSALAEGRSTITGLSPGEDVAATSRIVQQLGAQRDDDDGLVSITGPAEGLHAALAPLDCVNSGTTMRLLSGLVSAISGVHRLVGDASLSQRPMDRIAVPLALMGSSVSGQGPRITAPLTVHSPGQLVGLNYHIPMVSAQVKSALLFAGISATGTSTLVESVRTRTTTEDMLLAAGVDIEVAPEGDGRRVTLVPGRPSRRDWHVPGDPSQAAFFAVLGVLHPDAFVEVLSVDASPERVGFIAILQRMGGDLHLTSNGPSCGLRARSSHLEATEIYATEIPSLDEVPILMVAACAASGVSTFRGMDELRHKESDRFDASMALAKKLGCRVWAEADDFFVEGLGSATRFLEFTQTSSLDHRMVMAAAVAGSAGRGCTIEGAGTVSSSYPHFFRDLALLR